MLFELLNALKIAIAQNNKKESDRLRKQLNAAGMDNTTINYLLTQL